MGKFIFKQHESGEKSDEIVLDYAENVRLEITDGDDGDISLYAVDENDGYYNSYVYFFLDKEEIRKLAGILQYFADIGELPPNFEALQS